MDEEINYRTLRKIQEIERNFPTLSEIKSGFYNAFIDYLKNLNKRFSLEKSSQKKILISDELENIKKIGISIYEQREKKILLAAISKARGGNPDLKNIIEQEKILFDSVYELILKSRKNALEIDELIEEKETKVVNLKDISIDKNKTKEKKENTNPIIRINQDIPEFIGTDGKKYNLKKNDIISLQDNMSDMLIKRKAAQKINR
jgi:DNA replication initiation complex subunit (GINS family)